LFSPASVRETGPKSVKAAIATPTNQRVTRGRIKRLDRSIARPKETTPFMPTPRRFERCQKQIYTSDKRRPPHEPPQRSHSVRRPGPPGGRLDLAQGIPASGVEGRGGSGTGQAGTRGEVAARRTGGLRPAGGQPLRFPPALDRGGRRSHRVHPR